MRVLPLLGYLIVQITVISGKRRTTGRGRRDRRLSIGLGLNRYLGCFIDRIEERDLELFVNENDQLTPEQCISSCQELNYRYAGIQYASECRCGDQYGKHGQVSEDECGYSCSTSEKCGGDKRNSVYDVIQSKDGSKAGRFCFYGKRLEVKTYECFCRFDVFEYSHGISRLFR